LATAPLLTVRRFGMIDKDISNDSSRNSVKVNAILEGYVSIYQSQIGFVDESGSAQRMLLAIRAETSGSKSTELAVNQGHQFIESTLVAIRPLLQ
jgi:hypothetical protein